jgi:hypothetical protein
MTATIWMTYWQSCMFAGWCLTPIETIFQLYRVCDGQFFWWRKPEDPKKTTNLSKSLTNFVT